MRSFDIPTNYRSDLIGRLKAFRKVQDPKKKDLSPTLLDLGAVRFVFARHFGFCYGVENAIEISYKALEENPGKRIFLLSQMIHNPEVNADLESHGLRFIQDTHGEMLMDWNEITKDDIVIIPAFGTTIETENRLKAIGIDPLMHNTTCPFVEKVWKRSAQLGVQDHTVVIHGKAAHEETRATFSHTAQGAPAVIVKDMAETIELGRIISGEVPLERFHELFGERCTPDFDPATQLDRIGVVNQTTMLATETQAIADHLKQVMLTKYGEAELKAHFADTRDTLCYATNDNQDATNELLKADADLALVVGGYNSSNTSHLVELLEQKFPTFFINGEKELLSATEIEHFNYPLHKLERSKNWLPTKRPLTVILTSGASCPDTLLDQVMLKVLVFVEGAEDPVLVVDELVG
ncbi:MAG: 4-hydroxy-3-methylbut-2-enyl diphosphate reductase [Flavobacteriales bacterium]|nr:4-hydroxy-3-methylbut-2-enyl diphosphate reductase [Flavobacteriales bacterium]MBK6945916.1 4-hydroxy-3-methylbut-2-enyl diphosphate reductase [Flavobacteriales bacterium]MBK7239148.1 4-hydroxy-3-methylbut-2-enyl diphosphate reductase [Flavobacteriales bacterium]MBK7296662.1 4-hydroxy-3-methylbut-2-enyl diphosphate reductase [Flavobacteriales bacterium]MBK9536745.1 4-hydroxy-3-methylbut-2-enyl diphosphate reductase [Flavobacteriales bacterium]